MADDLHEELQSNGGPNSDSSSHRPKQRQNSIDKDAQEMVIASLRGQVQDLFSQVSELNNKLVKSYDRVSDLEDNLHLASANVRSSSVKISQLELERTQHLSALNTGLLVEKSHVTTELNRLMEKATEEAAQRGQAESARMAIEKDLDDLSATLFGQANSMVAEARYDRYLSERKVEDAERALKSAEEAVQLMQTQMQAMQTEKEEAQKKTREMELAMGKGKWVATRNGNPVVSLRLLNTHAPYQEYLSFVAHLRVLHPTSPSPPAMTTLLQLPYLHRLLTEDSESTVRLDLAPSLNWLSRRSVLTAIHSGQLTIEPVSATALFAESSTYPSTTTVAGMNSTHDNITCALCGVTVFPVPTAPQTLRASHLPPLVTQNTWSGSFFKKSLSGSASGTQPPTPTQMERRNSIGTYLNSQVFIFRMASLPTTSISSLPIPSLTKSSSQSNGYPITASHASTYGGNNNTSYSTTPNNQPTTIYPLCMSGWCLQRLRTTCTLWAFVRTGIVDKVWEEELPPPPPPPIISMERSNSGEKPPIPPRKRGLWGIASAIGERAASWSGEEKDKAKRASISATPVPPSTSTAATTTTSSHLPPAPPTHPSLAQAPPALRRLPPPLPPVRGDATKSDTAKPGAVPPPLPRRSEGRTRSSIGHLPSPPPEAETTAEEPPATAPQAADASPAPAHTHAPASIPLPESRPATPVGPSRAVSPAVALAAGVGATPPPIPRRAAARTRPVPGGSRPATPANAEVAPIAAPTPLERMESKADDAKEVADGARVDAVVGAAQPAAAEGADGEKAASEGVDSVDADSPAPDQSMSSSDVFVDALTSAQSEDVVASADSVPVSEADDPVKKLEVNEEEDDKATIVDAPVGEQPVLAEVEAEKDVSDVNGAGSTILSQHITEEPIIVDGADEKGPTDPEPEQEEDEKNAKEKNGPGYVGDGTWEEKTWKELVRLREDMFWARVGRVRE
ncbi:hypothetical protein HYPSUDRAFT_85260 [Hypholoma sublateritium FD-334 SS-4]|uniref:GDP/GTP exchange factor Sec2 N-terminal domain-containing protein n=1 Tax=Hypholoma sublateritium (strain FD-334 SS-4) TaxID=945553 RepID=A0A0D2MNL2_HYPSF|nr:hypothetical protein HYPSUDRAFT_85260 [Hypholoma sublateritium FD-334 SS-4]